jgi:hypothetical protein
VAIKLKVAGAGAKTLVSGGPIRIVGATVSNASAAACFVQLFDASATGSVTLGTTVPDLEVQCGTVADVTAGPWAAPDGVMFTNGLVLASTTLQGGSVASAAGVNVTILTN